MDPKDSVCAYYTKGTGYICDKIINMVRGDIENMDTADIGEAGNTENLP